MRLRDRLLTILGDIKVFRWPLFLIYDPGSYKVRGSDMRELIELVRPGDVLVRGYTMYLDGKFIPGYFSHAGLYVGTVGEEDRALAPARHRGRVRVGAQMVVHSVAEGVEMVDVLDFARCEWRLDKRPWQPDLGASLRGNGIGHMDFLQFRSPGLAGMHGAGN